MGVIACMLLCIDGLGLCLFIQRLCSPFVLHVFVIVTLSWGGKNHENMPTYILHSPGVLIISYTTHAKGDYSHSYNP